MDIWQILMTPFSWLLRTFCEVFNSYALALILFGVVVKLIMAPFQFKGKKGMIKITILNGQIQEIQKRCGQDRERYSREVQELYERNNVSPMGGCGWQLLPMLIMWPLYAIIRRPLKYLMNLTEPASVAVADALGWTSSVFAKGPAAQFNPSYGYSELSLSSMINAGNLDTAKAAAAGAGVSAASMFVINFRFLGIDLSQIPSLMFWKSDAWLSGDHWGAIGLFLLPVLSAVLSLVSSIITTKTNAMNKEQEESARKSNRMLLIMMPLMSLWIGFSFPAGLNIYWMTNSVLMMGQEIIFNRMLKKDYEAAQRELEEQARRSKEAERERRRQSAERKAAALASGKKKPQKQQIKEKRADVSASREGIRTYARGRAYDPNRYPVTPYHDPDDWGKPKKAEEADDAPLTEEEKQILKEEGVAIPPEVTDLPGEAALEEADVSEEDEEAGESADEGEED